MTDAGQVCRLKQSVEAQVAVGNTQTEDRLRGLGANFRPRHVWIVSKDCLHRVKIAVGDTSLHVWREGDTIPYNNSTYQVISRVGERVEGFAPALTGKM